VKASQGVTMSQKKPRRPGTYEKFCLRETSAISLRIFDVDQIRREWGAGYVAVV